MKISYKHLLNFLPNKPSLEDVSNKLLQLGHEHEVEDSIFDIEFTPNRGDCLSLLGLARDLNVFYETDLNLASYDGDINELELNFTNNSADKCPTISFLNIEIEGNVNNYKNYLANYFKDLNLNKNNFFTDISNYIAYEMGQPTHCYDLNTLNNEITLTSGIKEDNFETLLGSKISLDESDLVFLSNNKVINLAGIVGSMDTSCSPNTKNVLVECAYFSPEAIVGKSVKYNIQSDASHKFERGVDPTSQNKVLRRFISVVNDHVKIKKLSFYNKVFSEFKELELDIDINEINKILGIEESIENYKDSLSKLDFTFNSKIVVPSHRSDIKHQNDLAEEFARIIGYDNIPKRNIHLPLKPESKNLVEDNIRSFLVENGFAEVINYPFCSSFEKNSIEVDNPLDSKRRFIRTNIMDSLVNNLIYNEKRQKDSIKLFEISDIYSSISNANKIDKKLSIVVSGRQGHNYKEFAKVLDKQYLINLFKNEGVNVIDKVIEISRNKLNSKIKTKIYGFEIELNEISKYFQKYISNLSPVKGYVQYKPISEFPCSTRDLSFLVEKNSKISEVIKRLDSINANNLKECFMFDFYENKAQNHTKIGYRFVFQSFDKTLTDVEVDDQMKPIIDSVLKIDSVSLPGIK